MTGGFGNGRVGLHVELPRPVDDPRGVLEPEQQGVPTRRLVLETQVGVAHRPLAAPHERDAEQVGKAEVGARRAPLVAKRGLGGGNEAAAPPYEIAELGALAVGERFDVGQDQGLERRETIGVEHPVVDHLEGDAGLDERLVPAERRVLDPLADAVAAAEPRGLLRVHEPHPGQGTLVAQVPLGSVAPGEDLLDGTEPARVVQGARELREPGPHAVGDEVRGPEADLGSTLHGVLPPVGLLDPDAEEAGHGLAAHRGPVLLRVHADGPGRHEPVARLTIGHQHRRPLADLRHVQAAGGAAAGVGNDAGVGVDLAQIRVPEAPQGEEPLLPPLPILARQSSLRVGGPREVETGSGAEAVPAVHAVARAGPVPAVDEDAVHPVPGHDLPLHLGHELEVVGAQAAGDPHLRRGPVAAGPTVPAHRDPVRVRRLHVVVGGVRIGAGDDHHPEVATPGDELAEHVAAAQPRTAVVEGDRGRVVGDAAAGAQAGGVGVRALEGVEPERDVELHRVVFDQGELRPAHGLVDPRGRERLALRHGVPGRRPGPRGAAERDRRSGERGGPEELATRAGVTSVSHCGSLPVCSPADSSGPVTGMRGRPATRGSRRAGARRATRGRGRPGVAPGGA